MQYSLVLAAAAGLVSSASAHMIMQTPVPWGLTSGKLNNSPLNPAGTDFPCKVTADNDLYSEAASDNSAAVGDTVPLTFKGSAVHGGGSCQISLTTDPKPTKNSKWMVIYSIEGGCPAKQTSSAAAGNGAPSTYSFKIPEGVAPGKYTLAWTWFNMIGGTSEMYMNCAPFTVTGGKKRAIEARKEEDRMSKRQANFPAMHVANVCDNCFTPNQGKPYDGKEVPSTFAGTFPDPGANVDMFSPYAKLPFDACSCFGSGGSSSGANSTSSSSSSPPSSPASSPSAVSSPASGPAPANQATPASSPTPASQEPDSSSASDPTETTPASQATPATETPASQPPAAAAPAGGCTPGGLTCSSDGTQFGICAMDGTAVMRPVAPGTACKDGAITRA